MDVANLKCKFFNCVYKQVVATQYGTTCHENCDILANYIFNLENNSDCENSPAFAIIDDSVTLPVNTATSSCSSTVSDLAPISVCDTTSIIQEI